MTDTMSFEDMLITDMRANGGRVTQGPLAGHPLLVLSSRGARSGEPRRAILTWSRDGDDYVVAGTAGGSPVTPAWVHNLRAHAEVTIEAENRTFEGNALMVPDGAERDRLWDAHVAALPHFEDYATRTERRIPMIRIRPTSKSGTAVAGTEGALDRP